MGELDDFELRLSYRIVAGNSGIQYRSKYYGDNVVGGYQADFEAGKTYSGILYEERGRGILAKRGQKVRIDEKGKKNAIGSVGDTNEIQAAIKHEQWNDYIITARGNHLTHTINGHKTIEVIDDHKARRAMKGILALQIHVGPPMVVQFKNIRLKRLKLTDGRKKVVFVAGRPSHRAGDHEHNAGTQLLASCLSHTEGFLTANYVNGPQGKPRCGGDGWPLDPTAFDNADSIVLYMDGGGGHPFGRQSDRLAKVMDRGVGLACLHYAVEVVKGKPGEHFLDWIGGYFETHWSVNPHWELKNGKLAKDHPITRGVPTPFTVNDEWYYNMRFRKDMKGVTPILSGVPPDSTRERGFGPHSGNAYVKSRKGEEEIVAWAAEREGNDGRGFGFTGGHFHRNWGNEGFRKLVLNAIAWVSHAEVPKTGIVSTASDEDLQSNLDPKGRRRRPPQKKAVKPTGAKKFESKTVEKGPIDIEV
ncbi:MAG: family 16 glycoside hydrolase, partial [Planctomycetota bacterium]